MIDLMLWVNVLFLVRILHCREFICVLVIGYCLSIIGIELIGILIDLLFSYLICDFISFLVLIEGFLFFLLLLLAMTWIKRVLWSHLEILNLLIPFFALHKHILARSRKEVNGVLILFWAFRIWKQILKELVKFFIFILKPPKLLAQILSLFFLLFILLSRLRLFYQWPVFMNCIVHNIDLLNNWFLCFALAWLY